MASKYWLKLFHETIYDPKIMMRSAGARLRWYECLCLAGDNDKGGKLPSIENMIYVFRISEDQLLNELKELTDYGLIILDGDMYSIKNWISRQSAMDTNERSMRHRETKQKREYYESSTENERNCNDIVTNRDADIDKDKELDKDIEIDKEHTYIPDFSNSIQRMIENVTGLPPSGPNDIKAMDEIEKMNPLLEDIQSAYDWLVGQGKNVRYYSSLVSCVRTAIAKRIGSNGNKNLPKLEIGEGGRVNL